MPLRTGPLEITAALCDATSRCVRAILDGRVPNGVYQTWTDKGVVHIPFICSNGQKTFSLRLTQEDEHFEHLHILFGGLEALNIGINPEVSYVGYPSINLLGQYVDALELSSAEENTQGYLKAALPSYVDSPLPCCLLLRAYGSYIHGGGEVLPIP